MLRRLFVTFNVMGRMFGGSGNAVVFVPAFPKSRMDVEMVEEQVKKDLGIPDDAGVGLTNILDWGDATEEERDAEQAAWQKRREERKAAEEAADLAAEQTLLDEGTEANKGIEPNGLEEAGYGPLNELIRRMKDAENNPE